MVWDYGVWEGRFKGETKKAMCRWLVQEREYLSAVLVVACHWMLAPTVVDVRCRRATRIHHCKFGTLRDDKLVRPKSLQRNASAPYRPHGLLQPRSQHVVARRTSRRDDDPLLTILDPLPQNRLSLDLADSG